MKNWKSSVILNKAQSNICAYFVVVFTFEVLGHFVSVNI